VPNKLVLYWTWRHHHLEVSEADDLNDAVGILFWTREQGEGVAQAIEVWDDNGHQEFFGPELTDLMDAYEKRVLDDMPPPKAVVAKITVYIWVDERDNTRVCETDTFSTYYDMEKAQADYDRLLPFLGDRVKLERVS
jgi:hypothetical protein